MQGGFVDFKLFQKRRSHRLIFSMHLFGQRTNAGIVMVQELLERSASFARNDAFQGHTTL